MKPGTSNQRTPSWIKREWLGGLLLVLAVVLVYLPVWWAGYIWDDDAIVSNNPCIVGPLGLTEIWTTSQAQFYPLVLTTVWVIHAFWSLDPLPYHLVNVLMHGVCAVLLWRVLKSLSIPGAWLGAALWALHPVQVESASWISELKNTQSGVFYLLAILFFVKWLKTRNGWSYALTVLFAVMAIASKSSTVVLPLVLCLCAWWVEGRWQWRNLLRISPLFLLTLVASAETIWTQKLVRNFVPLATQSWMQRLITASDAVWFYLGKLLWPHPLIAIYPRWQIDAAQPLAYLPLLALVVLVIVLWVNRQTWSRPYFFALAYFLVALLPVLDLVDIDYFDYSYVSDHFQYLADMGPLALAGAGLAQLSSSIVPGRAWLPSALGGGLLLVLGVVSWQRAWVYESHETLWTDTLTKNPTTWAAYGNLGASLLQKGQVDRAIEYLQKAVEIFPGYIEGYSNLGVAFFQKGQLDKAIALYQKTIEMDPDFAEAHNNLGNVLLKKGQVNEAIDQFHAASKIDPYNVEVPASLGAVLLQNGQLDQAVAQFQKALEINPNNAEVNDNLGLALFEKGQTGQAISQFHRALELNPNRLEAHYNLASALLQEGRLDEAIDHYEKALEINPDFAQAHCNLGVVLFEKGRMDDAILQFQKALQLQPGNTAAKEDLAKVEAIKQQAH